MKTASTRARRLAAASVLLACLVPIARGAAPDDPPQTSLSRERAVVEVDPAYGPATPGWGSLRFDRVQPAVDAVPSGGTVRVAPGTYAEHVVISRPLALVGAGAGLSTLDGGGMLDVVRCTAPGVRVEGFTVRGSGDNVFSYGGIDLEGAGSVVRACSLEDCAAGVRVDAPDARITGSSFTGNRNSVRVLAGADRCLVRGNTSTGDENGFFFSESEAHRVEGNSVTTEGVGVYFYRGSAHVAEANWIEAGNTAVNLSDASGASVLDNTIVGVGAVGVRVYDTGPHLVAGNTLSDVESGVWVSTTYEQVTIDDNEFTNIPRSVRLDDSTDVVVTDNVITGVGGIRIDNLRGDTLYEWTSLTIGGNTIDGRPIRFYKNLAAPFVVPPDAAQVILANCSDVVVAGLQLANVPAGVQLGYCRDVVVTGCTIESVSEVGIDLAESDDITVEANLIRDTRYGVRIEGARARVLDNTMVGGLWGVAIENPIIEGIEVIEGLDDGIGYDALIEGNRIRGSEASGIAITASFGNTIRDNHVSFTNDAIPYGAIAVHESDFNVVTGNVVTNTHTGIRLTFSDSNEISGNLVTACSVAGIFLAGRSCQVLDNVLTGNGTAIDQSLAFNVFSGNTLAGNVLGLDILGSVYDQAHHNDFLNAQNAVGGGSFTEWDDGAEGNYWSDYGGEDLDLDGIGDTPYAVPDSIYVDHFPLMELAGDAFLRADTFSLSVASGGSVTFQLDAGAAEAGRGYILIGSATGRSPGTPLPGGAVLPLVLDDFSADVLANLNGPSYADFAGTLDGGGHAEATLHLPPLAPEYAGRTLYFAFLLTAPLDVVSVPIDTELVDE